MSNPVGIIGIAGSLRRASYNRAAMRAATQLVPKDASLDVFELDGMPGFNQDAEQNPPGKVVELKKRIRAADAMLIVMPEYNYSIPGALKNVIDWASRPYGDRAGPENRRRSWALRSAPSAQRFVLAASAASTTKHGWPGAQRLAMAERSERN
jgi:NAD(P)H-dependent FMN reductase